MLALRHTNDHTNDPRETRNVSTTARNIRVDDERWQAAQARAAAEGTNTSELIRQWLGDYAGGTAAGDALRYRPKPSVDDMIDGIAEQLEQLRGQISGRPRESADA